MKKIIVGAVTGLIVCILWELFFVLVLQKPIPPLSTWRDALPIILATVLSGAITGFLSLIVSRIVVGAIIITIGALTIATLLRDGIYATRGAVGAIIIIGVIDGVLISAGITLLCPGRKHT